MTVAPDSTTQAHRTEPQYETPQSGMLDSAMQRLPRTDYQEHTRDYAAGHGEYGGGGMSGSIGRAGMVPFRAGDWKCGNEGCSYHNFAKNVSCLRCGASKKFDGQRDAIPARNETRPGFLGQPFGGTGYFDQHREDEGTSGFKDEHAQHGVQKKGRGGAQAHGKKQQGKRFTQQGSTHSHASRATVNRRDKRQRQLARVQDELEHVKGQLDQRRGLHDPDQGRENHDGRPN